LSGNICDFYIASIFIPTLNGYFEVVTNDVDCFPQREYRYSWETKKLVVSPAYSASPGIGLRVGFNSHPFIQHCPPTPPPPSPPFPHLKGKVGDQEWGGVQKAKLFLFACLH